MKAVRRHAAPKSVLRAGADRPILPLLLRCRSAARQSRSLGDLVHHGALGTNAPCFGVHRYLAVSLLLSFCSIVPLAVLSLFCCSSAALVLCCCSVSLVLCCCLRFPRVVPLPPFPSCCAVVPFSSCCAAVPLPSRRVGCLRRPTRPGGPIWREGGGREIVV